MPSVCGCEIRTSFDRATIAYCDDHVARHDISGLMVTAAELERAAEKEKGGSRSAYRAAAAALRGNVERLRVA